MNLKFKIILFISIISVLVLLYLFIYLHLQAQVKEPRVSLQARNMKSQFEVDPFCENKQYSNETSNQIDPRRLNLTINPISLCAAAFSRRRLLLFVYIFSKVDNFEIRTAIRESWASSQLFPFVKFAFILGLSDDLMVNKRIEVENQTHFDIIQGNFRVN